MSKAPDAFRTISEVAEWLEKPTHVLRFWESKFPQVKPVKRAGGRRYYRPDDVALINGIRLLLQDRGMTIRGVQRILQEQGVRHVAALGMPLPERVGADADEADLVLDGTLADPVEDDAPHDVAFEALPVEPVADLPEPAAPIVAAPIIATPEPAPPIAAAPEPPIIEDTVTEDTATLAPPPPAPRAAPRQPEPELELAAEIAPDQRFARVLRVMPRGQLGRRHDRVEGLARRIDALLERMSEASGAGRW